jgi:DNA primase
MSATWVDFRRLREELDFAAVLRHYGVEVKVRRKDQHQGFCPLPTHPTHEGRRHSPSFAANLSRKCWQCFGCGASGNVIDFAVRMSGLDPGDPQAVRRIALELQERFLGPRGNIHEQPARVQRKREEPPDETRKHGDGNAQQKPGEDQTHPVVVVNAPLDFTLKGLDSEHPYLKARGFTSATIGTFGLGYCSRGVMQGRIVIPLHDPHGRLIGYAGRVVDDATITEQNPRYLFPAPREREGKRHEFHKSEFLYRGFEIEPPVSELVIVEGFASVWWLRQCGVRDVVALMGASCSDVQAKLIVDLLTPDGTACVVPDAGEAGERCAASLLTRVAPHRRCRWAKLASGQPTDLSPDEVWDALGLETQ